MTEEPAATFIGTITFTPGTCERIARIVSTRLVVSTVVAAASVSRLGGAASLPVQSAPVITTTSLPRASLAVSAPIVALGPSSWAILRAGSRNAGA